MFGGLCQNILQCRCGFSRELQVQYIPDVIPLQINGLDIQTCFENYFNPEEIDWKCPNCRQSKVQKVSLLITEPKVLILQLMRYKFDETQEKVTKIHQKMILRKSLKLHSGKNYSLRSVINHIGEDTQSGHYNVMLFDKETEKCILLDDEIISYNETFKEMETTSYLYIYVAD